MAQQIRLTLPPRDPREVLQNRLKDAPAEHAEALLSAYEVLQGLHDRGVLEILRGALGSTDEVLEIAVETVKSEQSLRGIRNLIVLVNTLGEIDPNHLKALTSIAPECLKTVTEHAEAPGLWKLAMDFSRSKDARRGLGVLNKMLETFGRALAKQ